MIFYDRYAAADEMPSVDAISAARHDDASLLMPLLMMLTSFSPAYFLLILRHCQMKAKGLFFHLRHDTPH